MKYFLRIIVGSFFIMFLVLPAMAADDEVVPCPQQSAQAVKFTDSAPTECKLGHEQIKISIPFPGLSSKTYYPVEYSTTIIDGKDTFCYAREPKKCYYVSGLQAYITILYNYAIGIVGIIAVTMIVYGGYQWILARGNSSQIEQAKETMIGAISGLVIALLSYIILFTVNPQIVKLSIPALPNIPPIEVNEAEYLCAHSKCGFFDKIGVQGEDEDQLCLGATCSDGLVCILDRSSLDPSKYTGGACHDDIQVRVEGKNKEEDGKYIDVDVEKGTHCGVIDFDYPDEDDVGIECDEYIHTPNTCYISPLAGQPIVFNYKKYAVDPAEGTRYGCLPQ